MAKKLLATLVLGLILGGCAAEQSARQGEDGETYGTTKGNFRSTWWGYAERGSSYLAGKFYAEAKTDLEKALEGRSEDSWRARTYGLHFVEYFPNRELGIVEFHLGNLEAAEAALKNSLEQVDTERAHYYLDLVRREKIAKGTVTDSTEPELAMVIAPAQITQATLPAPAPEPAKPEAPATPEPAKPAPPTPAPAKPAPIAEKGAVISTRELTFEVDTKDDTGVAGHLTDSLANHIVCRATPAAVSLFFKGPDAPLGAAIAVGKALIQYAYIALPGAGHGYMEAFDHFAGAVLEHPPGLHITLEVIAQLQARLLIGVITHLRAGAP